MKVLISINPAKNFEKLGEVKVSSNQEIKDKVRLANNAKLKWKEAGISKRIELLKNAYEEFSKKKEEIALLITREIGKPIKESRVEVERVLEDFKYQLENGEKFLADEITYQDSKSTDRIIYEPKGVAAVIVPWNYPFLLFILGTIPNLIAGNPVILKHSENCPLSGKLMGKIMESIGLPKGVFSEIFGDGEQGEVLASQDIDLILFTGSTKVGKLLYEITGKKFIKGIMEMGGSSPAIIFEDADLDKTLDIISKKRFVNCGQYCNATKRLIVHSSIFDNVVEKIKQIMEAKVVGHPEDNKTDIGSLVSKKQQETLVSQVKDAVSKGAKVIMGGNVPDKLLGAYYLPTLLTNVTKEMKVWKEEVFGPVLPIMPFKTEEEAIELANDTIYGLGARIYTKDVKKAIRVASKIDAGVIDINQGNASKSCNPFGGYKLSGMSRVDGKCGFRELCQIKVVSEG